MNDRQCARRHDQTAICETRKRGYGSLDFARIAYINGAYIQAERGRQSLDDSELSNPRAGMAGSRSTAARITLGAISFNKSNHFPLKLYSNDIKPVTLPPGRARLSTMPFPTGSAVTVNTIGTVRVASSNGPTVEPPAARITSGANATNSATYFRAALMLQIGRASC